MAPWPAPLVRPAKGSQAPGGKPFQVPKPYPARLPDNWRCWPELTVRLHELPQDITTSMIWDHFHIYGNIVYIDIYENRKSADFSVRIRFSPPPNEAF